jgi:propionate CoA-transferase
VDFLAVEGLLKRVIAGHFALAPNLGKLVYENKIEAYNIPQGTLSHMYRDTAARKVGTITAVGLGTYADPRQEGCRLNAAAKDPINEIITIHGKDYLLYYPFQPDFCLLRGTYADEKGNISMEKECLVLDNLSVAQAVKGRGGTVIVQVSDVVKAGTLDPHKVVVPGILVDAVVVVPPQEHQFEMTQEQAEVFSGRIRVPIAAGSGGPIVLDERKIIGRRCALELVRGYAVNLGVGMPEDCGAVAGEEGVFQDISLTIEAGAVGGKPQPRPLFGSSINVEFINPQANQFDFYHSGGLNLAVLGLAECNPDGSINVTKMGKKIPGAGGFIDIAEGARKVLFCGTFTMKGLKVSVKDGKLIIDQEGSAKKFLNKIEQITFNGKIAAANGREIYYVTERCVLALKKDGLHLIEIAPGIDIEKNILPHMEFAPVIPAPPKLMDPRIFQEGLMGLAKGF